MRWYRSAAFVVAGLGVVLGCGGGPTNPNGGGGGGGGGGGSGTHLTANLDGIAWAASTAAGGTTGVLVSPNDGRYLLGGTDVINGGPSTTLGLIFGPIDTLGTYPLGVDGVTIAGGMGTVTEGTGAKTWSTPLDGVSGTITITSITTTRIAGSFSYTAAGLTGGATGNRVVTSGDFDLPFTGGTGTLPATPDSVGGSFTASFNGTPWSAAIQSSSRNANNGLLLISGINTASFLTITTALPAGPGTYTMDNANGHQLLVYAGSGQGAVCCWGVLGDTGTMHLTSLTTTRARGTLTATLSPKPGTAASGTLTITNGSFDVGLFHTP